MTRSTREEVQENGTNLWHFPLGVGPPSHFSFILETNKRCFWTKNTCFWVNKAIPPLLLLIRGHTFDEDSELRGKGKVKHKSKI